MSIMNDIQHLGIIMDGNRRWAKSHGIPSLLGHQEGYENLKKIIPAVFDRGIHVLTLFAFSTENWKRGQDEVDHLLKLFSHAIDEEFANLTKKGVQVRFIGDIEAFPPTLRNAMKTCMEESKNNIKNILNIAVNYGGRSEIIHAIKTILRSSSTPDMVTEEMISHSIYTPDLPDPDLIIRTSGERRLSGFLMWQSAYSELYFTDTYWPEFTEADLDDALSDYAVRMRRFGL